MKTTILKRLALALFFFAFPILTAVAADDFCWKDSHPRGVGTIPTGCTGGKENQSGLCYEKCPAGMSGVGPVCWSGCPSGYTDMGAVCHINMPLTKSPTWVCTHWFPKWMGGACRWKDTRCPAEYTNVGLFCALTARPTPAGFSGTYLDPMKNTHARGAGTIPTGCGSKENDAGLCYDKCPSGMTGVGPVCWSHPPAGWVNCGMGNARDSAACASVIVDQVSSVGQIALTVATAGAGSEAAAGAKAGEKAALEGASEAEKAATIAKASANAKKMKEAVDALDKTINLVSACSQAIISATQVKKGDDLDRQLTNLFANTAACGMSAAAGANAQPNWTKFKSGKTLAGRDVEVQATAFVSLVNSYTQQSIDQHKAMKTAVAPGAQQEKMTPEDVARMAAQLASLADPTGVSSSIAAYTYPKCSKIFK